MKTRHKRLAIAAGVLCAIAAAAALVMNAFQSNLVFFFSPSQVAAKEALDISKEPEYVKKLYGVDNPITKDYATRCIIARRLVERGVRYVQVLNAGQSWDQHGSLITALPKNCQATDQPSAALLIDLKQRGLLDSTVVHWGGEMGRLPVLQNDAGRDKWGRDHNTYGFSMWVAGGGFKKGYVHGETDDFGHKAVIDEVKEAKKFTGKLNILIGTMIEIPRAALTADQIGEVADFFSFGTNDLTQMTFGFSRDAIKGFMPTYLADKVLPIDPFQTIDFNGVGELMKLGIQKGRDSRKAKHNAHLKIGICGEHGGDPDSVVFCHQIGMDYVSCSPFRVPIARLAAAQAALAKR